jgi:hypothetical protein
MAAAMPEAAAGSSAVGNFGHGPAATACLDSFQIGVGFTTAVWNILKLSLFALHEAHAFNIQGAASHGNCLDRLFLQCFER